MENKSKEPQNRREFFKEAAKKALPILGVVALISNPVIAKAIENEESGCKYCDYTCKDTCDERCVSLCTGCMKMCKDSCFNNCTGDCNRWCNGYCKDNCWNSCNNQNN